MGTEKLNELIRMNDSLRVSLGQACWLGCTRRSVQVARCMLKKAEECFSQYGEEREVINFFAVRSEDVICWCRIGFWRAKQTEE